MLRAHVRPPWPTSMLLSCLQVGHHVAQCQVLLSCACHQCGRWASQCCCPDWSIWYQWQLRSGSLLVVLSGQACVPLGELAGCDAQQNGFGLVPASAVALLGARECVGHIFIFEEISVKWLDPVQLRLLRREGLGALQPLPTPFPPWGQGSSPQQRNSPLPGQVCVPLVCWRWHPVWPPLGIHAYSCSTQSERAYWVHPHYTGSFCKVTRYKTPQALLGAWDPSSPGPLLF